MSTYHPESFRDKVNNTGTGQLDIESVSIGGTNYGEFSVQADHCTGVSVSPSGSCNIDLIFSPDYPQGSKSSTLTVVSNAPDTPGIAASLSGYSTSTQIFILSITKNGTGSRTITIDTGSLTWNGNTGTASYNSSTLVNISATAASNSSFTGWSGDYWGNASTCSLQVNSIKTVTATFDSKANFCANPIAGPAPLIVSFSDMSTNTPTTWLWNFGDGGASTLKNPVYTYNAPGNFAVSLTATGIGGAATRTRNNLITVTSCNNNPVKIGGTSAYYSSIQNAYNTATNGESVLMQAISFAESLNLQNNTLITLQGGFGCDFSSNTGFTTVEGTLTVNGGTVTVENLIVQ